MKLAELALSEYDKRKKELDVVVEKTKTELVITGEKSLQQKELIEKQNNDITILKGEIRKMEKMLVDKRDKLNEEIEQRKEEISKLESMYNKQDKKLNEQKQQMNELKLDIDKIAEESIKGFVVKLNELKVKVEITEKELRAQKEENSPAAIIYTTSPSTATSTAMKRQRREGYGS